MSSGGAIIQSSWATTRERGSLVLMRLMVVGMKLLSRPLLAPFVYAVTLYFYLFARHARADSRDYLRRVQRAYTEHGII